VKAKKQKLNRNTTVNSSTISGITRHVDANKKTVKAQTSEINE